MASPSTELTPLPTPDSKKRKRRKNFTIEEENVIQAMYSENSEILSQKFSSDITNKAKHEIWQNITDRVNSKGVCYRTVEQVKEKWGNMAQKAKKTFTDFRLQQRKTGGGPPPPEISYATANIIDAMKDTASFSGVPGGIDTEILPTDVLCGDVSNEQPAEPSPDTSLTECASTIVSCPTPVAVNTPASTASTSSTPSPSAKKVKKMRYTQEDVLSMQHKVLEGQVEQQALEKTRTNLETQRLTLQIELLQRLLSQHDLDINLNPTQLLMSMLN